MHDHYRLCCLSLDTFLLYTTMLSRTTKETCAAPAQVPASRHCKKVRASTAKLCLGATLQDGKEARLKENNGSTAQRDQFVEGRSLQRHFGCVFHSRAMHQSQLARRQLHAILSILCYCLLARLPMNE